MVRMVDLVKSGGKDGDPDPRKKKKSGFPEQLKMGSRSLEGESSAPIDLSGSKPRAGKREKSLHSPTSLDAKTKNCPYIGGRKERGKIIDYPALSNVCYAEGSREKKLLRTITYPFSVVPAQRQREFCLATYNRCPLYQSKQKEESG